MKSKIAAAQLAPVFLNKEKTIEKACKAILEAGSNGAKLIVFPEAYISGYPDMYASGNTINFAPLLPASKIALQAFSIVFSLFKNTGANCAAAIFDFIVLIVIILNRNSMVQIWGRFIKN